MCTATPRVTACPNDPSGNEGLPDIEGTQMHVVHKCVLQASNTSKHGYPPSFCPHTARRPLLAGVVEMLGHDVRRCDMSHDHEAALPPARGEERVQ